MFSRMRLQSTFSCKVGKQIIPFHAITRVDCDRLEELVVVVHLNDGSKLEALDIDAVEIMMQLKPSVIEGHRLSYGKGMWTVHNLLGHPLLTILAWFHQYKQAFWVHDVTVPKPRGRRTQKP
jgi:hypothetical protein